MMARFERGEIRERDGVLYISITAFYPVASERISEASYQITERISNRQWRYKDGQLLAMNEKSLAWEVFSGRSEESDFVLAAVKAHLASKATSVGK
jgi:hypothetical protein